MLLKSFSVHLAGCSILVPKWKAQGFSILVFLCRLRLSSGLHIAYFYISLCMPLAYILQLAGIQYFYPLSHLPAERSICFSFNFLRQMDYILSLCCELKIINSNNLFLSTWSNSYAHYMPSYAHYMQFICPLMRDPEPNLTCAGHASYYQISR